MSPDSLLTRWLAHPATRGRDIDAPETTLLRRQIIAGKPFLRALYEEWYRLLIAEVPRGEGRVLELGSGAGFLEDLLPEVITSDVLPLPGVDHVLDAHSLPFADASLRAIVMTNVFHHLRAPKQFLSEAARAVRPGGVIAMIEPWHTRWSRLVYQRLHHEPFDPESPTWEVPGGGPLSAANGALPWIVFFRDRARFEAELPEWQIRNVAPLMPLAYLFSGGVSRRGLLPGLAYQAVRLGERALSPWRESLAMFALVTLVRTRVG